jgi:penicillin-binding protein 2
MGKRAAELFFILMILMLLTVLNVYSVSNGTGLAETAQRQSTYELTIARTRGTIYDCNKVPLVGADKEYIAAVAPTVESTSVLNKLLSKEKMTQIYPMLSKGKPFSLKVSTDTESADGFNVFTIDKLYN